MNFKSVYSYLYSKSMASIKTYIWGVADLVKS